MLINSFVFFLVFPAIFFLYWLIPTRLALVKKLLLLVTSIVFYGLFSVQFLLVLLFIIVSSYFAAFWVSNQTAYRNIVAKIWIVGGGILLPLLYFKYFNFICEIVAVTLQTIGLDFQFAEKSIIVPIGLSFYTFQALGYVIDVYRGNQKEERNFIDYCLFIAYFPQIVSGPISKASELLPQIKKLPPFDYSRAVQGLRLLLWGVFLKTVIADRACIYVNLVYDKYESLSGLNCILASFLYTIQIYGDFAGYSLMAVGISKTLGFDIINNFNRPYFATSITDFWRRWHISLTRWLTQYVYIGLGGNRISKGRTYLNIMITFLVSGLWHGANWTFVVWGAMHGIFQVIEKFLGLQKCNSKGVMKLLRIVVVFCVVNLAWVFFRSDTIGQACGFIQRMFSAPGFAKEGIETLAYFGIGMVMLFSIEMIREFYPSLFYKMMSSKVIRWSAYLSITAFILLFGILDGGQFIYANF